MTDAELAEAARGYVDAFGTLQPDTVDALVARCAESVRFCDPFNDVTGRAALTRVFADMFENTEGPRFEILALDGSGRRWIAKWRFTAGVKVLGGLDVTGLSEIELDESGLVAAHNDYWDAGAAVYARVPVIGGIVRAVRRRLSADG